MYLVYTTRKYPFDDNIEHAMLEKHNNSTPLQLTMALRLMM